MTIERTAWTSRLLHVPSWALSEELQRRGDEAAADAAVDLPDLRVDPVASTVTWRGEEYALRGRMMEVLYALALSRQAGRRRAQSVALAQAVWRGWDQRSALESLRTTVHYLRKKFPGLVEQRIMQTYELALDDAPVVLPVERSA